MTFIRGERAYVTLGTVARDDSFISPVQPIGMAAGTTAVGAIHCAFLCRFLIAIRLFKPPKSAGATALFAGADCLLYRFQLGKTSFLVYE